MPGQPLKTSIKIAILENSQESVSLNNQLNNLRLLPGLALNNLKIANIFKQWAVSWNLSSACYCELPWN